MQAFTNDERRHTIANGDIPLDGDHSRDDNSTVSTGVTSKDIHGGDIQHNIRSPSNENNGDISKSSLEGFRWRMKDEDIGEIPEFYPRLSYPLILRDCKVGELGDRLWDFLKINSVRSTYDYKEGRVLCHTHLVSFVLQFWRRKSTQRAADYIPTTVATDTSTITNNNTNADKSEEEEIILEIQRRQGCSYAMQKIRTALKKSIRQRYPQKDYKHHRLPPLSSSLPPNNLGSSPHYNGSGMIRYEPLFLQSQLLPLPRPASAPALASAVSTRNERRRFPPPLDMLSRQQFMPTIGSDLTGIHPLRLAQFTADRPITKHNQTSIFFCDANAS